MKKKLAFIVFAFMLAVVTLSVGACKEQDEDTNYHVAGIWHAHAEWHVDNSYNYGGDNFTLDVYYEFNEDSTLRNRLSMTLNTRPFSDTGWVIFNGSWEVNKNTITLSSGKQFVIIDDEFNDTYPNPKMILHFFKKDMSEENL